MKKLIIALVSSLACLLFLAAFLTVILAIMNAITLAPGYLLYALIGIPLFIGGKLLLIATDRYV